MNGKKKSTEKIMNDIKNIKIQGAKNIAKAAAKVYSSSPSKFMKRKLLSLRPTEPMMENMLDMLENGKSYREIINELKISQTKINNYVLKLIKNKDVVFTHCHSTSVVNALIYAKNKGKKFEVYNTETRPLYQGRKTFKELRKAGIKVTLFVDSAMGVALSKRGGTRKTDKVFLGADAITDKGVVNKIGSGVVAQIAREEKIPFYIVADSWKFTKSKVPIENRKLNEVWDKAPKNIRIKNPAFEFVPKKYITKIISELGIMNYDVFLRKVRKS